MPCSKKKTRSCKAATFRSSKRRSSPIDIGKILGRVHQAMHQADNAIVKLRQRPTYYEHMDRTQFKKNFFMKDLHSRLKKIAEKPLSEPMDAAPSNRGARADFRIDQELRNLIQNETLMVEEATHRQADELARASNWGMSPATNLQQLPLLPVAE